MLSVENKRTMLSVIKLNVVMLSVVSLGAVLWSCLHGQQEHKYKDTYLQSSSQV